MPRDNYPSILVEAPKVPFFYQPYVAHCGNVQVLQAIHLLKQNDPDVLILPVTQPTQPYALTIRITPDMMDELAQRWLESRGYTITKEDNNA